MYKHDINIESQFDAIGETTRHFSTHVTEHFERDKESHEYKYLWTNPNCMNACNPSYFSIMDQARMQFQLRIKEDIYIKLERPSLNNQVRSYKIGIIV